MIGPLAVHVRLARHLVSLTALRPDSMETVFDHLPDLVIRYDREDRVLYVNRAFTEITGVSRDAVVGKRAQDLDVAIETIQLFDAARRQTWSTGTVVTFDIRRATPSGERRVEYRMIPERGATGEIVSVVAVGRDVTEREISRAAVEAERARLVEAQRVARLGSWSWDLTTGESHASDELERVLGTPDARHRPIETFISLLAPEEQERMAERLRLVDELRLPSSEKTWRIVRPDGESRHVHARSVWSYGADGTRVAGAGTFQDVTDQVEAAAIVTRQHALLEESQRLARVGSWELDLETGDVTWSDEMYRIVGLEPGVEPMSRERAEQLIHPDDAAVAAEQLQTAIETLQSTVSELRMLRPDGTVRVVAARMRTILGPNGVIRGVVGTCQDITERRLLEDQVRQAQKMEALGLLAGSIAHDFNNLLSAILGGAELARLDVADDSDAASDLDTVRQAAARAASITQQLLAFSRKQAAHPRVMDLRSLVYGAEKLLRRMLPDGVALDIECGPEPVVVRADPAQLEQVLFNLVVNARDAIVGTDDEGEDSTMGVITIEVRCVTLDSRDSRDSRKSHALLPASNAGRFAALRVRDTGVGMDVATRERIFEPFFTTKPVGKGTGIGLASVLGIASQNLGGVDVESAPGEGSTFTFLLPLVDEPAEVTVLGGTTHPSGTETILLVEDEAVVRQTAARILERHGYNVLTARHGADALLVWHAHPNEVQLLVTDLRMPEMGGQALISALRAECPGLPVVITSGYASGRRPGEKALLSREPFLAKPFTTESLLVQVRAALNDALRTPRTE